METEIGNPDAMVAVQLLQDNGTTLTGGRGHGGVLDERSIDCLNTNKFRMKLFGVVILAILYN